MQFGAHLPIAGFGGERPAAATVLECAEVAEQLGYSTLCANDHLTFSVPWIDGLIALGAAAARTRTIRLMTTASLLVVRGATPLGSAAVALAHLSCDRLTICLTPGSTASDYEAVGIPFEERWTRFRESIPAFKEYIEVQHPGLPVWVASWGSEAGLRIVALHGDGWLASAYHATPAHFSRCLSYLDSELAACGRGGRPFPNAVATTYMHVTDTPGEADSILGLLVSPRHAPSDLRDRSLIGSADECIARLRRLEAAGVEQVLVWPLRDEAVQLRRFAEEVAIEFRSPRPTAVEAVRGEQTN